MEAKQAKQTKQAKEVKEVKEAKEAKEGMEANEVKEEKRKKKVYDNPKELAQYIDNYYKDKLLKEENATTKEEQDDVIDRFEKEVEKLITDKEELEAW